MYLLSGIPSSWLPKKLRFVMQDVLRKSEMFPSATLQVKKGNKLVLITA